MFIALKIFDKRMLYIFICSVHVTILYSICFTLKNIGVKCKMPCKHHKRRKNIKQNNKLNDFQQLFFSYFFPWMNLITNTKTGSKIAPRLPKLS